MGRYQTYLSRETNDLVFIQDTFTHEIVSGGFSNPNLAGEIARQMSKGQQPKMLTDLSQRH